MKCQSLFPGEKLEEKNPISLSFAEYAQIVVKVKEGYTDKYLLFLHKTIIMLWVLIRITSALHHFFFQTFTIKCC